MIDENLEGFKKAFMEDKTDIEDDCPMADQVTDYAFGELDSEEGLQVREHIQTCRQCLELYMDIRLAEEEGKGLKMKQLECFQVCKGPLIKTKNQKFHPFAISVI
jgi:hypothetical protein